MNQLLEKDTVMKLLDQAYDEIRGVHYTIMALLVVIAMTVGGVVAADIYEHMTSKQKETPAKEVLCIGQRT